MLKLKILEPAIDDDSYEVDGGRFTITAITFVHLGRLHIREDLIQAQNRLKRRGRHMDDSTLGTVDAPYYEWRRRVEPWSDYAVTFEIRPEFGSTAGSTWAALATAALTGFSAGYTGTPQPLLLPHQTFEFKAEFQDFRVYRDGQSLLPLHPGRQITERAFQNYDMTFIDEAYSGMYTYALDDFMTGETFRFEVFDAREPERVHKVLNLDGRSELIRQIRADFTEPIGTYEEAEVVASWLVLHDHSGGSFERSCSGRVVLTDSKLIF